MEVRPVSSAPDAIRLRNALELWDQVVEDWCLNPEESLRLLGYPQEGHGFSKRENQIDALERLVAWFDRYL